jgi:nuclear GTP-binding protein
MGTGKKEKNRKIREGKVGDGMANVKVKGENFYRSAKKVKVLNVLTKGTAQHNARGIETKAAVFQSKQIPQARVEPNRKASISGYVASRKGLTSSSGFRTAE